MKWSVFRTCFNRFAIMRLTRLKCCRSLDTLLAGRAMERLMYLYKYMRIYLVDFTTRNVHIETPQEKSRSRDCCRRGPDHIRHAWANKHPHTNTCEETCLAEPFRTSTEHKTFIHAILICPSLHPVQTSIKQSTLPQDTPLAPAPCKRSSNGQSEQSSKPKATN